MLLCFLVEDFSSWQGTAVKASAEFCFLPGKTIIIWGVWLLPKYSSLFHKGSWQTVGTLTNWKPKKGALVSGKDMSSHQILHTSLQSLLFKEVLWNSWYFLRPVRHMVSIILIEPWTNVLLFVPKQRYTFLCYKKDDKSQLRYNLWNTCVISVVTNSLKDSKWLYSCMQVSPNVFILIISITLWSPYVLNLFSRKKFNYHLGDDSLCSFKSVWWGGSSVFLGVVFLFGLPFCEVLWVFFVVVSVLCPCSNILQRFRHTWRSA